ncbi:queuosine precursor transporter [Natronomonas sp. F2-12]|jgi:uncharacterized integral membrane protein (TIGR00697 family)|uniref:Probable queuosine precursor transporter n=1 Tax=Natronomonas aquatica TaxID=2841590 RepID=A0A9R1CVX0_9EURY|nr:queuosine precursor transporter [Natronomonas aquatica]MCQ4334850.1 queuosine precursor transporter [Natronomonas aquatica]
MSNDAHTATDRLPIPRLALIAIFVTALITSQVTAAKIVAVGLPFAVPLTGDLLLVPAAAFAYAVTFFASDCYAELYGRQAATQLVNVAFVMNFVLLGLVWLAISAPVFPESPVGQEQFSSVLGASTGVIAGSLLAYLISQNWDVIVFHRIRDYTDGKALWLRNLGSTITSQLIDTVIFITIAFVVFQGVPLSQAVGLIVGQYIIKLAIAVLDTPFVYATVGAVRNRANTSIVTTGD